MPSASDLDLVCEKGNADDTKDILQETLLQEAAAFRDEFICIGTDRSPVVGSCQRPTMHHAKNNANRKIVYGDFSSLRDCCEVYLHTITCSLSGLYRRTQHEDPRIE